MPGLKLILFPDVLPGTFRAPSTHESTRPVESLDPSKEGSRDYLKITTCKTTADSDSALTGPIFGGNFAQDIHSPTAILDTPENQTLRRFVEAAVDCNHSIIHNRSVRHRHHGIWFDIRSLVAAAVVLSAVIKSGALTIPPDWENSFEIIIEGLRFW
jgi:hypothetical protein